MEVELDLLCPAEGCGGLNRIEAEYCRNCGEKLTGGEDYDVKAAKAPLVQCPHCSQRVPVGCKCDQCGKDLPLESFCDQTLQRQMRKPT